MTERSARVVLVDDHAEARTGLRTLLALEPDLNVVGEADSGTDALALCRRLNPDLVLLDVRLPDMSGLAVVRTIKDESPDTNVIVVTLDGGPAMHTEALRSGADAYVLKGTLRAELLAVIRGVLRGPAPTASLGQ